LSLGGMDHHQPQLKCHRQQQAESPGPLAASCRAETRSCGNASSPKRENIRVVSKAIKACLNSIPVIAVGNEDRDDSAVRETGYSQKPLLSGATTAIHHPQTLIRNNRWTYSWTPTQYRRQLRTTDEECDDEYHYHSDSVDRKDEKIDRENYPEHVCIYSEQKENKETYHGQSPLLSRRRLLFSFVLIGGFTMIYSLTCLYLVSPWEFYETQKRFGHGQLPSLYHDHFVATTAINSTTLNGTYRSFVNLQRPLRKETKLNTAPQKTYKTTYANQIISNVTENTIVSNSLKRLLPFWPSSLPQLFLSTTSIWQLIPEWKSEKDPLLDQSRRLSSSRSDPLSSSSSSSSSRSSSKGNDPQLVIAGKMTVDDAPCNIAQYNLRTKGWSLDERIQLSLYNSYTGGQVYSLLANHTDTKLSIAIDPTDTDPTTATIMKSERGRKNIIDTEGSGELIVVGAFDTTYRNSQVTYCSVGKWDGLQLSKVGEGLCNSALSKGMKITTAAMAGPQDVYAAGSFQTQVWNGDRHEFVKIYNIAHYNAAGKEGPVWLPLNIGQITCSWCTVTVLALAWDSKRQQLHVAGKFNSIDGRNIPAGLAIYDVKFGRLLAHPGGGLAMRNRTQDGVGTALQLDEEKGVLYVMGSFQRLTSSSELCYGLAAYDINSNTWTCLANPAHTVQPTGGGNMILTPHGLMVAGKTSGEETTWKDDSRPYTIALLHTTLKTHEIVNETSSSIAIPNKHDDKYYKKKSKKIYSSLQPSMPLKSTGSLSEGNRDGIDINDHSQPKNVSCHEFEWSWLPGFSGNDEPLHALANGFGDHYGAVFIAGDNLVAKWSYQKQSVAKSGGSDRDLLFSSHTDDIKLVAVTEELSTDHVRGGILAISQMQLMPDPVPEPINSPNIRPNSDLNIRIFITLAVGCLIGILGAVMCNRQLSSKLFPCFDTDLSEGPGMPLDTLSNSKITDAYQRAMRTRYVEQPHLLTIIDPQEIFLQRIIGHGTFGRVWSARWKSSSVAVKEFVFAQAAVIGRSSMQQQIVEEIIGEAGMMAILRHPHVLQLFGCSLTAQAIWIVSELCSLGSLRQLLDDRDRSLPDSLKVNLALQVAEGMSYLHNQDPSIIHRDLKSHNIFVHETFIDTEQEGDSNINGPSGDGETNTFTLWRRPRKMKSHSALVAKIGDWGSARATLSGSRTMTHGVGTTCWLAPEVIKHARSSKYSDVYGYGIILWEMSTREEVHKGLESTQIIAKVANEGLRPDVPNECPWSDLMCQCWAENPHDRLGFNEVVTELNRIGKELEDNEVDLSASALIINQSQERQKGLADIEEEAPLIKFSSKIDTRKEKKNGRKLNIFSNILNKKR